MDLFLEKATESDAESIFDIQVKAFTPLLKKYKDYDTSPANETVDKVITRINNPLGGFYKIVLDQILAGAIRIHWNEETTQFWISPMFILPDFQGKGFAQKVLILAEEMFPKAASWELATILEEERNCYLYEKMGYCKTGITKKLNEDATLVFYKKNGRFSSFKEEDLEF
ncbi:GNAT family N-acetyltransferase [Bacillus sp. UMB0893]|uniref:GNAT family N-acetyltransferase n=1 Tax=Bacillus sp. UMB0893 TaxID=2066053 RepID=UPI000C782204|nr:GNAT family N-acetyltransferase [Bacillus sp. UMB0893]PLR66185.1 GNAT family N-acetyltransferase [Bacillus sp. UMB0893]